MASEPQSLNEHVFEVRYRPNARVIDNLGAWAHSLCLKLEMPAWRIQGIRIDVREEDGRNRVFIAAANCGCVCRDSEAKERFPERAISFFKCLDSFSAFDNPLFVLRIGVRSKFATRFDGTFDDLAGACATRYVNLSSAARSAIGGELVDIGAPLNFRDKLGYFNTSCGPMKPDQLKLYLPGRDEYPSISLFYDIDYWLEPREYLTHHEVTQRIGPMASAAWERHLRVQRLILGE